MSHASGDAAVVEKIWRRSTARVPRETPGYDKRSSHERGHLGRLQHAVLAEAANRSSSARSTAVPMLIAMILSSWIGTATASLDFIKLNSTRVYRELALSSGCG